MSKNIKVCYTKRYIIYTSELTLELENTAEKEHITWGTTLQDILVEPFTFYQDKSERLDKGTSKNRLHKLKRSDASTSISKKHSKQNEQKKMTNEDSKLEITYYVLFYTYLSQKRRKH